jgi:hypothetical protein
MQSPFLLVGNPVVGASGPAPILNGFTINGDPSTATAAPGVNMTLDWDVSGATNVQLTTGSNYAWSNWSATGTTSVNANGSRNFFLRASSDGGVTWPTFAAVHSIVTQTTSAPNLSGIGRYDNFTRANSSSSLGSPSDGGSAWTALTGTWGISSNQAINITGGTNNIAVLSSTFSDVSATFTLPTYTFGVTQVGVVVRASDANNFIFLEAAQGIFLKKYVAGSLNQIIATGSPASGDRYQIVCIGSTITCYQNGVLLFIVTDSFNQTATNHGLYANTDNTTPLTDFAALDASKCLDPQLAIPDFCLNPTTHSTKTGSWFDSTVWSGGSVPGSSDVAVIQNGHIVTVDGFSDVPVNGIGVQSGGSLEFATNAKVRLTACQVVVYDTDGSHGQGYFEIGNSGNPVNPTSIQDQTACLALASAPYAQADFMHWGAGLYVFGKARTYGQPTSPGYVRLATAPQAGDRTLSLSSPVTGWTQGDRLYIPDTTARTDAAIYDPTSYYDVLMLEGVSPNGLTLTVSTITGTGLYYSHPGSSVVDNPAAPPEYLPHVVNMSRWASIRTTDPTDINRPHVFCGNRADVDFEYTTFHSTGRAAPFPGAGVQFNRLWGPFPVRADGYQFSITNCSVLDPFPVPSLDAASARWGIVISESGWGLVQDNVVINWGGAGITPRNGNERQNTVNRNFVGLIRGNGDRSDQTGNPANNGAFNHPENQGPGNGVWCRNADQIVTNNVVADCRSIGSFYAYSFSVTPLSEGGTNQLSVQKYTPAYQGANPYSGNPADIYTVSTPFGTNYFSPIGIPIRNISNNEGYSSTNCMTIWFVLPSDIVTDAFSASLYGYFVPGVGGAGANGTIQSLTGWTLYQWGIFLYPTTNVTIDGCIFRGCVTDNSHRPPRGIHSDDYCSWNLTVSNCDIRNFDVGLIPAYFGQYDITFEDCHLVNKENILIQPLTSSIGSVFTTGNWVLNVPNQLLGGPRSYAINNCTYAVWPGFPLVTIYGSNQPFGSTAGGVSLAGDGWTSPVSIAVTDHQGVANDDFSMFLYTTEPNRQLSPNFPSNFVVSVPQFNLTNAQSYDKFNNDGTIKKMASRLAMNTPGLSFVGQIRPPQWGVRPDVYGFISVNPGPYPTRYSPATSMRRLHTTRGV